MLFKSSQFLQPGTSLLHSIPFHFIFISFSFLFHLFFVSNSFFIFIFSCSIDNGGCDLLTVCNDTVSGPVCGPCPTGFSGDGENGCADIDECVPTSPCEGGTACTNTNLSTVGLTRSNLCICNGIDCVYVNSSATLPNSGGQYFCTHYSEYTTLAWGTAQICDNYQQQNGNFNFTLLSNIVSNLTNNGYCTTTTRWYIQYPNTSQIYKSVRIPSQYPTSTTNTYAFTLDSCVSNYGCTEVISCGLDTQCLIAANTCFNTTTNTEIRYDNSSNTLLCPPNFGQIQLITCPMVGGQVCLTLENAKDFYINGQYVCESVGSQGCVTYTSVRGVKIRLTSPSAPTTTNCTVLFIFYNYFFFVITIF